MGMFTPSEAGAVAVVYCLFVGAFIYKELKWKYAWPIMKETIYGTSSVCLIIVVASFFGYYMNWERIPQRDYFCYVGFHSKSVYYADAGKPVTAGFGYVLRRWCKD